MYYSHNNHNNTNIANSINISGNNNNDDDTNNDTTIHTKTKQLVRIWITTNQYWQQ